MRQRFLLVVTALPLLWSTVAPAQPTDSLAKAEAEAEATDDQAAPAAPSPAPPAGAAAPAGYSSLKPAPPAGDGTQPRRKLVTVFGTEPCPKPTSPDEVVVCARLPDSEQYRIPPQLRKAENQPSPFQQNRALLLGSAQDGVTGAGAVGSCSTIGPGAQSGCNQKDIDAWAADRSSRMGYSEPVPPQ